MPLLTVSDSLESVSAIFPETEAHRNNLNGVVFLLVTGGKGMLELDGRAIPLCKGALVSVLPFHLLQLLQQERLECRILAFAFDFMDSFPFVLRSQISERMEKVPHILLDAGELNFWWNAMICCLPTACGLRMLHIRRLCGHWYLFGWQRSARYMRIKRWSLSQPITSRWQTSFSAFCMCMSACTGMLLFMPGNCV